MSEFDALLDELDMLRKSAAATDAQDDDEIVDMADGDADYDGIEDGDEDLYDEPYSDEDDAPMAKSFAVTFDDGSEGEAYDGTEIIEQIMRDMDAQRANMTRALELSTSLIKSLSTEVQGLREHIEQLGRRPAGRKSVLHVHEKPDAMAKADSAPTVEPRQIMAKALAAQRNGRLHGAQVAEIEAYMNRGIDLPRHLAEALDA